jgi:hypothetical protein
MTWGTADDLTQSDSEIATANSPVWILGLAFTLGLIGFATTFFLGMGGAVAGYIFGLAAFTCILVFRRLHGVLSQTSFVNQPGGLNAFVTGAFAFTVLEVIVAVWPIATEVSRG